jgi:hypothetical protein
MMLMLISIIMVNGGVEGHCFSFPYGIVFAAIAGHECLELAAAVDT